jgi:hypothetical protein
MMSDHSTPRPGQPAAGSGPPEVSPPGSPAEEILDDSLSRLAVTGPEYAGGLSNHGPMGAEAMIRLNRAESVGSWLDGYLRNLDEAPRPATPITDDNWRDALGSSRRVADWELYLRAQLAGEPWQRVLACWWPRLLPGVAAAATHGVIRTSHAARSLAAAQTAERSAELARALAYWAASYLEVPGSPVTAGQLSLEAAVSGLPIAPGPVLPGLITVRLRSSLSAEPAFPAAVTALRPPADVPADMLQLAARFARMFLTHGRTQPIDFLHAVTAPVAARSVLGLLPAGQARPTYDALWQVAAGLYTAYAAGASPEPLPTGQPPSPGDLADQAVGTGDVHAIKLTEACLRLYAESPDPLLLQAAGRGIELLG